MYGRLAQSVEVVGTDGLLILLTVHCPNEVNLGYLPSSLSVWFQSSLAGSEIVLGVHT